jgi:hypothetical protein
MVSFDVVRPAVAHSDGGGCIRKWLAGQSVGGSYRGGRPTLLHRGGQSSSSPLAFGKQ